MRSKRRFCELGGGLTLPGRKPAARHDVADYVGDDAEAWSRAVTESLASTASLKFSIEHSGSFAGSAYPRPLGDCSLIDMDYSAHRVQLPNQALDPGHPVRWVISLSLSSTAVLSQAGKSVLCEPGDLSFYDTSKPLEFVLHGGRELVMSIPRKELNLPPEAYELLSVTKYPTDSGLTAALASLLKELFEVSSSHGDKTPDSGRAAARAVIALTRAIALRELEEMGLIQPPPDARVIDNIERFIEEHLADPELNPRTIAGAHFISTRHLHAIFKPTGTTVAVFVRQRRLERAKDLLTDPANSDLPVAAIARLCGFHSVSHFGSIFREFTGLTPGEYRATFTRG